MPESDLSTADNSIQKPTLPTKRNVVWAIVALIQSGRCVPFTVPGNDRVDRRQRNICPYPTLGYDLD